MRKLFFCAIILFCFAASLFAAPCYGTKMPKQKEIFMGLQDYTVFKRYLDKDYGKLRSVQNFLLLSYGVFDWLSLDLKGGWGNIKQHPVGSDEIDYPSFLGGGYGFRVKIFEKEKIKTVFGFQHISVHPKSIDLGDIKHKAVLDDWQFSLLGSYSFAKITPYLGTKWSRMDYIHWDNGSRKQEKSELAKSVGLVMGFDLPINEKLWVNLEGQLCDVEAVAFSLNYSF